MSPGKQGMSTKKHWEDIFRYSGEFVDIVLQVLDARNPIGTHNTRIEELMKQKNPEVKIALVLNKIDLIPKRIEEKWVQHFEKKGYRIFPISARHSRNIAELKNYMRELAGDEVINVLITGYPNSGKSTLIFVLAKEKKKVGMSPIAGYTRAIQTIKISEKIYLIDSPGIIPLDESNETEMAIKSCMNADKLEDPMAVVEFIVSYVPKKKIEKTYDIELPNSYTEDDLIEILGKKYNKYLKGGIIDENQIIKMIIRDWQQGKIKYYFPVPGDIDED